MKSIILYGSQYGTTKSYAIKLAELTGIGVYRFDQIKDISNYEMVIYFGGLYAGGVKGIKDTVKYLSPDAKFIIATVGLADVLANENINNIRESLKKQVPDGVLAKAAIFHLRGGINYKKLNTKHKMMMALLHRSLKNKPLAELSAEDKLFMDTYNQEVCFVDFHALQPIKQVIMQWQ